MCFFSLHPGNMIDLYTFSCYDYWTLARQQGGCLHLWRANHLSLSFQYTQRFVKGETRLFSRNVWQEEQDVRRALPYTFFPIYGVEEGRGTRQVKQEGSQSVMPRVYLNCVEKPPLAYSDCNNSAPPPTHNTQTFCFQDRRLFFFFFFHICRLRDVNFFFHPSHNNRAGSPWGSRKSPRKRIRVAASDDEVRKITWKWLPFTASILWHVARKNGRCTTF